MKPKELLLRRRIARGCYRKDVNAMAEELVMVYAEVGCVMHIAGEVGSFYLLALLVYYYKTTSKQKHTTFLTLATSPL